MLAASFYIYFCFYLESDIARQTREQVRFLAALPAEAFSASASLPAPNDASNSKLNSPHSWMALADNKLPPIYKFSVGMEQSTWIQVIFYTEFDHTCAFKLLHLIFFASVCTPACVMFTGSSQSSTSDASRAYPRLSQCRSLGHHL